MLRTQTRFPLLKTTHAVSGLPRVASSSQNFSSYYNGLLSTIKASYETLAIICSNVRAVQLLISTRCGQDKTTRPDLNTHANRYSAFDVARNQFPTV